MVQRECAACGKEFYVKPYRADKAKFCGRECMGRWRFTNNNPSQKPNNHLLGNQFRKGKRPTNAFTPEEVRGENNPKWKPPIVLACSNCGVEFSRKKWLLNQNKSRRGLRFCSVECLGTYEGFRGPNDPRYIGGPKTYRGRGWLAARKLAVERDGGRCQSCGKDIGDSIPVHHVRPFREFATAAEANHLDNLVCCCQSCHMKLEWLRIHSNSRT